MRAARLAAALVALALAAATAPGAAPTRRAGGDAPKVVFTRGNTAYVADADGSHVRLLAEGVPDGTAWSADGTRAAYPAENAIWLMDGDGSHRRRLIAAPNAGEPAWSPDGTQLAYVSEASGDSAVWAVDADGSDKRLVATHASQPAWSPDGSEIAYRAFREIPGVGVKGMQIFAARPDGTGERQIEANVAFLDIAEQPTWSVNGEIAFTFLGSQDERRAGVLNGLFRIGATGLSPRAAFVPVSGYALEARSPRFSPDGETIAFESEGKIYTVDRDGSNLQQFAPGPDARRPQWIVPKGKCLAADCVVYGFEVTQGIQNRENRVPLIESRRTFVRVSVASQRPSGLLRVSASLIGERGGKPLAGSPLRPIYSPITVHKTIVYGMQRDYFLFELPRSWLHGTITLQLRPEEGDVYECAEGVDGTNDCRVEARFEPGPRMELEIVPIVWTYKGRTYNVGIRQVEAVVRQIKRLYPIADLDWHLSSHEITWGAIDLPLDLFRLENAVVDLVRRDHPEVEKPGPPRGVPIYLGLYAGPALRSTIIDGIARGDLAAVAHVDLAVDDYYVPAHEIGHTLGRLHAPCGLSFPQKVVQAVLEYFRRDAAYPYGNASIGTDARRATMYFGFDPITRRVYAPTKAHDLMSYCPPHWISAYTYDALRDALTTRFGLRER